MTALHGVCWANDQRDEKPRFKGVELYSWKGKGGDWLFVLLDGTNRVKTKAEINRAKNQIKGAKALGKALARLAVGEDVFWTHRIEGFEFPPEATRKKIKKAAKEAKIVLRLSGEEE